MGRRWASSPLVDHLHPFCTRTLYLLHFAFVSLGASNWRHHQLGNLQKILGALSVQSASSQVTTQLWLMIHLHTKEWTWQTEALLRPVEKVCVIQVELDVKVVPGCWKWHPCISHSPYNILYCKTHVLMSSCWVPLSILYITGCFWHEIRKNAMSNSALSCLPKWLFNSGVNKVLATYQLAFSNFMSNSKVTFHNLILGLFQIPVYLLWLEEDFWTTQFCTLLQKALKTQTA